MQKNTITKWLIQFDSNKELQIIEKEVSKYAPINRILDRVWFFRVRIGLMCQVKSILLLTNQKKGM